MMGGLLTLAIGFGIILSDLRGFNIDGPYTPAILIMAEVFDSVWHGLAVAWLFPMFLGLFMFLYGGRILGSEPYRGRPS